MPRFRKVNIFSASACGLAAHIRRPLDRWILAEGAATVPITGGKCECVLENRSYHGMVSLASCRTSVDADFIDPGSAIPFTYGNHEAAHLPMRAIATTSVRDLEIVNRGANTTRTLKLTFESKLVSESLSGQDEPSVRPEWTGFNSIFLDGVRLRVTVRNDLFNTHDTFTKVSNAFPTMPQADQDLFFVPAGETPSGNLPTAAGMAFATVVSKIEWDDPATAIAGVTFDGNLIKFPDFGDIYLGELCIARHQRNLTMLRVMLGSPDGGDLSAGASASGSGGWPP